MPVVLKQRAPDWGTDASTKKAKQMTPNENAVQQTKDRISREKEQDKIKHDRMLDRARLVRARRKNAETNPREGADKMNGVKFNPKDMVTFQNHNPVAKHARKFNKSAVMRDRKKDSKRGYTKHKGKIDG